MFENQKPPGSGTYITSVSAPQDALTQAKAIFFDLDGTLVDSVPDLTLALGLMLESLGFQAATEEDVRIWVGNGAHKLVERALGATGAKLANSRDFQTQAFDSFLRNYHKVNGRQSRLYPGVKECLEKFTARNIPLVIITNKPLEFIEPLLSGLKIYKHFSFCLGGDSLPKRKPAPDQIIFACERLGLAPGEVLMVGDSQNDIRAARAAGCPVLAVDYGYNHGVPIEDEEPDLILSDLRNL